jgi:tetratricopeptide (TPR) repeat protein
VTGDKSIEANVRYADFLVWGQQYEELKNVALQLANAPGVDAKVYRYLGLIAVNQDGDFEKGVEYFDKLFAEADTSRLIDLDYLFAGFANIQTGNADKGVPYLAKALEKNPEIMPEIGSAGMLAYQNGSYEVAQAILSIPAQQVGTDYYYEANYVLGNAKFRSGVSKKEKGEDPAADFAEALKAFDVIIKSNDQKVYDEYLAGALYLTGYVNISLDNVNPETPELCQGLFVPAFTELTKLLSDKQLQGQELTDAEKGYLVDAYNYIGYYHITKEDYDSALQSFENTVKVAPEDEFANAYIEYLKS